MNSSMRFSLSWLPPFGTCVGNSVFIFFYTPSFFLLKFLSVPSPRPFPPRFPIVISFKLSPPHFKQLPAAACFRSSSRFGGFSIYPLCVLMGVSPSRLALVSSSIDIMPLVFCLLPEKRLTVTFPENFILTRWLDRNFFFFPDFFPGP